MPTADLRRGARDQLSDVLQWKVKFSGLEVSDNRMLETLEDKNASGKAVGRTVAGRRHTARRCINKMVTSAARRDAVAHLCRAHQISQWRACSVLGVDWSSVQYRSVRSDDAEFRKSMKAVAAKRRRLGYLSPHVMQERHCWQMIGISPWHAEQVSAALVRGISEQILRYKVGRTNGLEWPSRCIAGRTGAVADPNIVDL